MRDMVLGSPRSTRSARAAGRLGSGTADATILARTAHDVDAAIRLLSAAYRARGTHGRARTGGPCRAGATRRHCRRRDSVEDIISLASYTNFRSSEFSPGFAERGTEACTCALTCAKAAGVSAVHSKIETYRAKAKE